MTKWGWVPSSPPPPVWRVSELDLKQYRAFQRQKVVQTWRRTNIARTDRCTSTIGKIFFILTKKWGFVQWIRKYRYVFNRIFLIEYCFSTVLDSKSADTKAETLSTEQKCKDIKNLAIIMIKITIIGNYSLANLESQIFSSLRSR